MTVSRPNLRKNFCCFSLAKLIYLVHNCVAPACFQLRLFLCALHLMKIISRDEDPDPLIFGPPDPDQLLFSLDSDPDPTCNKGFIKLFLS